MRIDRSLLPAWALLAGILLLFHHVELDLLVQDLLYEAARGRWLVDAREPLLRALFYHAPKFAIITSGLILCALLVGPRWWLEHLHIAAPARRNAAVLVLSIALIPLLAGQLKATTGVYCPAEISRYGGTQPYIRLLDHRPAFTRSAGTGHCFPCGHASGGFALFALIGLARSRRGQWSAFGLAMLAGWAMGAYQMAKGAHYLSHVLVTMLLAWIVFLLLRRLLRVQSIDAVGSTGRV